MNDHSYQFSVNSFLAVLVIVSCIPIAGCIRSYEEREAQEDAERKALLLKKQQAEAELLSQISERFNCIEFPPRNLAEKNLLKFWK